MEEGDVFIILKYLENKQAHDLTFKYEMQVDKNYNIINIFMADGRAIMDYNLVMLFVLIQHTRQTSMEDHFGYLSVMTIAEELSY